MCRRGSGGLMKIGPLIAPFDAAQASSGTEAAVGDLLVELAQQGGERKTQALFGSADLLIGCRREEKARARGIVGGQVMSGVFVDKRIICRQRLILGWLERIWTKPARPLAFLADGSKQGFWLVWHGCVLEFLRVHLFSSLYATKAGTSRRQISGSCQGVKRTVTRRRSALATGVPVPFGCSVGLKAEGVPNWISQMAR